MAPPKEIVHFTLGHGEALADLIWLRYIQEIDRCENPRSDHAARSSSEISRCHLGWAYQMVDLITTLAPRFFIAHSSGAMALSIAVDDREGARRIYERAIANFPKDWNTRYRAGYHYLYEVGDVERAAQLFREAAALGGQPWVHSLAAKLYSQVGKAEVGRQILIEYLATNPTGLGAARAKSRLQEIEKTLAAPLPKKPPVLTRTLPQKVRRSR